MFLFPPLHKYVPKKSVLHLQKKKKNPTKRLKSYERLLSISGRLLRAALREREWTHSRNDPGSLHESGVRRRRRRSRGSARRSVRLADVPSCPVVYSVVSAAIT